MAQVFVRRGRSEPLRMATLAVLFIATLIAAVVVPRQIAAVLHVGVAADAGAERFDAGTGTGSSWAAPSVSSPATARRTRSAGGHHHRVRARVSAPAD